MSKISIDKTLIKGSPKQRAILVLNHVTDINSGGKGLLSEADYNSVYNSFKTDHEVKIYNKFRAFHTTATNFLSAIAQYRFMHMVALERLDKFIIMYKNNLDTEDLVNLLIDLVSDKEKKTKAQKIAKDFSDGTTLRKIKATKGGLVETDNSLLLEKIQESREEVDHTQKLLKTSIKAIKDYLDETGLNVKIFSAYIKETENWAQGISGKGITRATEDTIKTEWPERLVKLFKKYRTELPYEKVEIDKDSYDHIRKTILINESKHD